MIRVCVVSSGMPHEHGGAELRALRHVQYLRKQPGFDACLIAWDHKESVNSKYSLPKFIYPIYCYFQEKTSGSQFGRLVHMGLYLSELVIRLFWRFFLMRNRMDIVQIIFAASWFNLLSIPIAKLFGKPVIIEMTDRGVDDPLTLNRRAGHPEKQLFPHQPLKYKLFLMASGYVSKSQPLSDAYLQSGLLESRLSQIASAVAVNKFSPANCLEEIRATRIHLDVDPQRPILLFVGRINYQKGLDILLPALRQVIQTCPNALLLVAGPVISYDQDYASRIHGQVSQLNLMDHVRFIGRISNVDEYLKASDIFVLPTRHEGLSGAILEAMSCGLPIVASDIPEISESQITHGVQGLLTPVGDVDCLARALTSLICDPDLRQRLGQAARGRILREFTPEIIGTQYMNLYRGLISNGHRKALEN